MCDPDSSPINCSVYVQVETVCRGSPANRVQTVYSGHSSFGMYCMMFLGLHVQAQLSWKWAQHLRPTVQFFLLAFALSIGYTRGSDHKHWRDVLVGLLQGSLVAGLAIRFQVLVSQRCLEEEELD